MDLVREELADVPAQASVVTDAGTRRRVLEHRRPLLQRLGTEWVSHEDDTDDLVAHAPMVEITFEGSLR